MKTWFLWVLLSWESGVPIDLEISPSEFASYEACMKRGAAISETFSSTLATNEKIVVSYHCQQLTRVNPYLKSR